MVHPKPGLVDLIDRFAERAELDRLVGAVRAGESRSLVVCGDPGIGKSVLLDYLAGQAHGCRVARVAGVQSEMQLVFAGLHQLCAPMLAHLSHIPEPQRDALRIAFGVAAGPPPDRFLVGLAVLSLLSEVAGERPLICLVDDAQWLDRASAQALGFAARRLAADPVGLVFAARHPDEELDGLATLEVGGLRAADARALLASALAGPLDAGVRELIVAETRGNPLALLELPRGLSPAELAGGFGLPGAAPLTGLIEEAFTRQLSALPDQTRRLLQLAAADLSGDQSRVQLAAGRLGIAMQAADPAMEAGLAEFDGRIRFRHPLMRSAAYRSASFAERRQLHAALAEVTDPAIDPDQRAWHRAQAALGPDEEVAAELEDSAGRAQARGGLAAVATFLERAALLTADPARHAERSLAAAQASMQAGAFAKALDLLAAAEAGPLDEFASARADLLRGRIAFVSNLGGDAPSLLLKAAKRLEPLDLGLARQTYLIAWSAASLAGHLAGASDVLEVSRAVRALPPPEGSARPIDLLLNGLARLITDGPAAAAPTLRQAVTAFTAGDVSREEGLRYGWLAAAVLWDEDAGRAITTRQVQLARDTGALEQLSTALIALAMSDAWRGDFGAAASLIAETDAVAEVIASRVAPYTHLFLAALRGSEAELTSLRAAANAVAAAEGQGLAATYAQWVAAISHNGLGRYAEAFAAARQASEHDHVYVSMWALPELIEAAARTGNTEVASSALDRLAERTQAGGTDCGLGLEARSRALVSQGQAAESCYLEAIDRLGRTRLRPDLARAHLLYGEWLRRAKRSGDARAQLRTAHGMLDVIGMAAFAERARGELVATGESVPTSAAKAISTLYALTAQEASVARLAQQGRTNTEIGTQLFLSARTVEWHLRKVYIKLGISSRRELTAALTRAGLSG